VILFYIAGVTMHSWNGYCHWPKFKSQLLLICQDFYCFTRDFLQAGLLESALWSVFRLSISAKLWHSRVETNRDGQAH